MSDNWIPSGNDLTRLQLLLRQGIQALYLAVNNVTAAANIMAQMFADDSTGGEIATNFGFPQADAVDAKNVVGSAATALADPRLVAILQRLG